MSESDDAARVSSAPGLSSGLGLSFSAGQGLPGRVRGLSSPTPPGRLTSLRIRDLTLGGALKKPKKTFEPNVHALRKSKDELKEDVHVAPKKERRERDERKRESRGRRRERPQTIQSHSIFEQSPVDTLRKTAWRGVPGQHDSTTSPVCKLLKKERDVSEEDEEEILSKLQRDDFIEDPGLKNDAKLSPIQLPLNQPSSFTKRQAHMTAGPEEHPTVRPSCCGTQTSRGGPRSEQPSLVEVLQELRLSDTEELFFLQLPDCLPAAASAQKVDPASRTPPDKPAKQEGKAEDQRPGQTQGATVKRTSCPVLSQFPEGFLGKLQIRKSGKVELKLGDIVLDVSEGAAFSFLQQLVSVHLCEGQTGDMMVLGNVRHKLVFSPDFQALLRQAAAQQQQQHKS